MAVLCCSQVFLFVHLLFPFSFCLFLSVLTFTPGLILYLFGSLFVLVLLPSLVDGSLMELVYLIGVCLSCWFAVCPQVCLIKYLFFNSLVCCFVSVWFIAFGQYLIALVVLFILLYHHLVFCIWVPKTPNYPCTLVVTKNFCIRYQVTFVMRSQSQLSSSEGKAEPPVLGPLWLAIWMKAGATWFYVLFKVVFVSRSQHQHVFTCSNLIGCEDTSSDAGHFIRDVSGITGCFGSFNIIHPHPGGPTGVYQAPANVQLLLWLYGSLGVTFMYLVSCSRTNMQPSLGTKPLTLWIIDSWATAAQSVNGTCFALLFYLIGPQSAFTLLLINSSAHTFTAAMLLV